MDGVLIHFWRSFGYSFFLRLERCRGTALGVARFETSFEILFWEGPAPPTKKRVAMLIAGGGGEGGWIASGVAFFCPSPVWELRVLRKMFTEFCVHFVGFLLAGPRMHSLMAF